MKKWNYTDEQRKAVKNLGVSANILKSDIEILEIKKTLEGVTDEQKAEFDKRIEHKLGKIEEKKAKILEIQAEVGQVDVPAGGRKSQADMTDEQKAEFVAKQEAAKAAAKEKKAAERAELKKLRDEHKAKVKAEAEAAAQTDAM